MRQMFLHPSSDGEPPVEFWRKGIVFTCRPQVAPAAGYRISAAYKGIANATPPPVPFRPHYDRVTAIAGEHARELATGLSAVIDCHGWSFLGAEEKMVGAFVTLALQSTTQATTAAPDDDALSRPAGTSLTELSRLAPQTSEVLYNEFDFTGPSNPDAPITVSYGELAAEIHDFEPFVRRAEAFAESYSNRLRQLGEARSAFRILHREWFLADRNFVTVHVCFAR